MSMTRKQISAYIKGKPVWVDPLGNQYVKLHNWDEETCFCVCLFSLACNPKKISDLKLKGYIGWSWVES